MAESYFNDTEIKTGGLVKAFIKGDDYIIYGGRSFDQYKAHPSVTKIDTLGNVIWTTTDDDLDMYEDQGDVHQIFESDGYIYALAIELDWPNYPKEVWKIDASNGQIEWKHPFYLDYFDFPRHFIDYDEEKLLMAYFESNGAPKYAFVSKTNGDTLSTHPMGANLSSTQFSLAKDAGLNIYYTFKDTIYKADATNPDNILWKNALPPSYDIVDHMEIYIDSNDSIFLFSRYDNFFNDNGKGKVIALNSTDGSLLWEANAPGGEVGSVYFVDRDGHIYATWRHSLVGGGYGYWTSKIDKSNGNIEWDSYYNFGNGNQGARSIDVDDNGDVFLTGYFGDANYGPEDWGVLKLEGNTGDAIYELNISIDSLENDDISIGIAACVINNKPYFLGELETYASNGIERSKVTFIEIENSTGELLQRKHLGGSHQFLSKTVQIENYGYNHTLVLKQVGRFTELELYNYNKTLEWRRSFEKDYMLFPERMTVGHDGNIVVSARSVMETDEQPYYSNITDRIYVFKIDFDGTSISENSFEVEEPGIRILDLWADDNGEVFIFYRKSNAIYYRKIDDTGSSDERDLSATYTYIPSASNYSIPHTDSTLLFFNNKNIKQVNKNTLASTTLGQQNFVQHIHYVHQLGEDRVLLCGRDNNNMDMLAMSDPVSLDTIWKKGYVLGSQGYKFILDEDDSHIYTVGVEVNNVFVRKIAAADGQLIWSHVYDCPQGNNDYPIDISLDQSSGHITVTGYSSASGNQEVFIIVLDADGALLEEYLPQSAVIGANIGWCTEFLPGGSTWIGGQINHPTFGMAGFVYEADTGNQLSTISGYTYFDENENGIKDSTEIDLSLFKVILEPSNAIQFTDTTGRFIYFLENGDYILSPVFVPYWEVSNGPPAYAVQLDSVIQITDLNFGFSPVIDTTIIAVVINSGFTRCDSNVDFDITAKNNGTAINTGMLWLETDSLLQSIQFNLPPDSMINNHLFGWRFSDFYPSQSITQHLSMTMPGIDDGIQLGDSIVIDAYILTDEVTTDTFGFTYTPEIFCAFDPNDKLVHPDRAKDYDANYTLFEELLTYTIRFQNTGTDTAFNVIIRDTLDANLNANTLDVLSTSHPGVLRVMQEGPHLEFSFENIMLPDSSNTYETSQGYVSYSIRAKENLEEGTLITNRAGIYFDNNPPVITNETANVMVSEFPVSNAVETITDEDISIMVYPNPIKELATIDIRLPKGSNDIEIRAYDLLGREWYRSVIMKYDDDHFTTQLKMPESNDGLALLKIWINGVGYTYKIVKVQW